MVEWDQLISPKVRQIQIIPDVVKFKTKNFEITGAEQSTKKWWDRRVSAPSNSDLLG